MNVRTAVIVRDCQPSNIWVVDLSPDEALLVFRANVSM